MELNLYYLSNTLYSDKKRERTQRAAKASGQDVELQRYPMPTPAAAHPASYDYAACVEAGYGCWIGRGVGRDFSAFWDAYDKLDKQDQAEALSRINQKLEKKS